MAENKIWAIPLAVSIVIALSGGGWKLYTWLQDRNVESADRVASCESQHELDAASQVQTENFTQRHYEMTGEYGRTTFATCEWPAPSYADADGYNEVTVLHVVGPGKDEASGADAVDRIQSDCHNVQVSYTTGNQGDSSPLPPMTLHPGDVVDAWEGQPWAGRLTDVFYPERDEIDVVRNDKVALDALRCV